MTLTRIEKERQEVRMAQFLSLDSDGGKDVELTEERFKKFEISVTDNQALERFPVATAIGRLDPVKTVGTQHDQNNRAARSNARMTVMIEPPHNLRELKSSQSTIVAQAN